MASLVKTAMLKIVADDADAQEKLDRISAKADELRRLNPDIKVKVDAAEAAAKLAVLRREIKDVGNQSDSSRGPLSRLGGALGGIVGWLGPGGSTFGSGGFGVLSGLSLLGPLLGGTVVAGAAAAAAALFPVIATLGLVTAGIGAFAAAAVPEISKVWTAVSKGGAAMKSLTPDERALAEPIRDLKNEFHQLEQVAKPFALIALKQALLILKDLMPAIRPLVHAAGLALADFLGHIDAWLKSGSGQKFIDWIKRDGPNALMAFGHALYNIIAALGRTFDFLYNFGETVHHVFDIARHDIAHWADDAVHDFRIAEHDFDEARHTVASWGHDVAHIFDTVRGAIHSFFTDVGSHFVVFTQFWRQHSAEIAQVTRVVWHAIETVIKVVLGAIVAYVRISWALVGPFIIAGLHVLEAEWHVAWAVIGNILKTAWQLITEIVSGSVHFTLDVISVVLDLITGHWSKAWHDMEHLTSDALHTIRSIIISLVSGFGTLLFDAGRALITGLINGIKSMFGAVGGVMSNIAGMVKSFLPFSPAKQGPLSGAGSPQIAGARIAQMLAQGIDSGNAGVGAAARRMAGAVTVGGAGARPGGGGAQTVVLQVEAAGSSAFEQFMIQAIRQWVRTKGGGNVQAAFGRA